MQTEGTSIDIDAFWEYSDPALSEARFRSALSTTQGDARLELLTQIARTFSLRRQFEQAHTQLNDVEQQLFNAGVRPHVRYLLERGRTYNSSGDPERARTYFSEAWQQAKSAQIDGLAVDAAHMIAITYTGTIEAVDWNERGLAIARVSTDNKARSLIPAMLNNSAWELHELGRFAQALVLFEEAQTEWVARGKPQQIQIATWSVGRCLRSLGRYTEALALQSALEQEHRTAQTADGYVFEEIAENLAALGNLQAARPYFERAWNELSQDSWFVQHESARLATLKARASDA